MKRSFLLTLCMLVATAFAGPYNISEFAAQDAGAPDEFITAEFGGELKTATIEDAAALQEGRLVVRQKFVDPFGEAEPSYQLYQGTAGDLSSMSALSAPEGTSYSDLLNAKFYERRGMKPNEDIEKAYFDGKAVYIPGKSSVIAFINGSPVEVKGAALATDEMDEFADDSTTTASADEEESAEEECDEETEECDEEEEDYVDVASATDETESEADERDYSAYDASENATDRFGIADEVRFWSAVGLAAVAVGSAVMGVIQHSKANEAKSAYDDLSDVDDQLMGEVKKACTSGSNELDGKCVEAMKQKADLGNGYTIAELERRMKTNKDTQDSYSFARNIWFGVAGATLTAAIVLYVW